MKYVLLVVCVLIGEKLLAQQADEKKPVMIFEQNANAFFSDKDKNDIDRDQKLLTLARQANLKVINSNILNALKTGSLTRTQRAILDFANSQSKKCLSDLPASYYDAALAQFP